MLIGNAGRRRGGKQLLRMQCDENEWKCQSAAHAAILAAAGET